MELLGCGFNASGRLSSSGVSSHPANDLFTLTSLAKGEVIDLYQATLKYTKALSRDGNGISADIAHSDHSSYSRKASDLPVPTAQNATGEVLRYCYTSRELKHSLCKQTLYYDVANGDMANERVYKCDQTVKQIEAFDTGFVILYEDGTVATMGDPRFENCLGRIVTETAPSNEPVAVPDLTNLGERFQEIAAGGYTAAALTVSGSLYVWGMSTLGIHRRPQAFTHLAGIPNYVEVDGCKDVASVGIGESHAIVSTTDGCVYTIGSNRNGQLGLGKGPDEYVNSWTLVDVAPSGKRVAAVNAGPRSSFVLMHDE